MYNYVKPKNFKYPYFNFLNLDVFRRQLDYFEETQGFISKKDFFESIDNNINPKGFVLTFDDGLKDHFKYVLPELAKRNLWGIFYVSSDAYKTRKLLDVHRIQYLKGKFGATKILKDLINMIDDHMLDHHTIENFDKEIYLDSSYNNNEKKLRRMLNYYISYKYRSSILDDLMIKYFDEDSLYDQVYSNIEELKKIKDNGHIIGSHAMSHKVLSRLSFKDQEDEIKKSFEFLVNNFESKPPFSFCYPYGYKSSYNTDTLSILKSNNIHNAVVFDNKAQGPNMKRLELSRLDCNQFMDV